MRPFRHVLSHVLSSAMLLVALCLGAPAARADTPITLFKSFAGNINFTGTEETLRTKSNSGDPCATTSSVTMSLSGIPSGATVLAAYLYWAGSGSTGDYVVAFEKQTITAPVTRRYASGTVGYDYFSGAADVTDIVKAKGNASYAASGLTIEKDLFCAVQGVLGGFQLLVVYSQSQETFRVLNVYEGFQYIRNSSVELTLANFLIPNPIGSLTGRVGHITWEGDTTLSGGGETLRYNGVEQVDSMNTSGNQFNSASNINGDTTSYGIDFDAYTVKSPVIASGQKSAKTTYSSGQDLVLLNAEIIAAPNVPATDRGVSMVLDGVLVPSAATTYSITVTNNGPMDEGGPLTVTGTLPAALIYGGYASTSTNWKCVAAGQLVTCTYTGTFTRNTTLPVLTLTVTPAKTATGLITFGVTVGGKLFDYYDGNDTSTVSARVGAGDFTPVFIFTDKQCVHNKPFGDAAQPCKPLAFDPHPLANTDLHTYITYVVKNVPTALASSDTTLKMRFALSCHDPTTHAGVNATYNLQASTVALPLCQSLGAIPPQNSAAWSTAQNILYPGSSPSSKAVLPKGVEEPTDFVLRYPDVGRIELFVTDDTARLGSTGAFVSRPERLLLLAQSSNGAKDPASASDPKFVPAGAPFTMTVRAMMPGLSNAAPNFGRETDPVKILLTAYPATASDGAPIDAMVADLSPGNYFDPLPLRGDFGSFVQGIATGNAFAFDEAGVIKVDSSLKGGSYLGSGDVVGTSINVGRFYPDYFNTIVTGPMECVTAAVCPTAATTPVSAIATMAYSRQPFAVKVEARGRNDNILNNYRNELARDVLLSAWKPPGGSTTQAAPTSGSASSVLSSTAIAAGAFAKGVASATPTYTFPAALAYVGTSPAAGNWPQPVSVYVRAVESSGTDGVTSKRTAAVEGGVQVVSGRMWVPNQKGAGVQAMNIEVKPQLYGTVNGQPGWYDVTTDSVSTFTQAGVAFTTPCGKLPGATSCKLDLKVDTATVGTIAAGLGMVKLLPPAAGSNGWVYMYLSNPLWLPSVYGTLTYGTIKSPYTYLREMY